MTKWSLLFLLLPVATVALFAVAPSLGWDLPENVSTFGQEVDRLYYIILAAVGVVFVGTQGVLVYVMMRFAKAPRHAEPASAQSTAEEQAATADREASGAASQAASPAPPRALYTHGNTRLEILWTVVPAVVLIYLTVVQIPGWVRIKQVKSWAAFGVDQPDLDKPANAIVLARQFEWRIAYPGPDGVLGTPDDVHVSNEIHVVKDQQVKLDLRTMDVIHSLFLPQLRMKQDILPGMRIPMWFTATRSTHDFQAANASLTPPAITDAGDLLAGLGSSEQPTLAHLRGQLPESVRQQVADYAKSGAQFQPPADLVERVRQALNEALASVPTAVGETVAEPAAALRGRELLVAALPNAVRPAPHYEFLCTELCGWGHYKMRGRLVVHETQAELDTWLAARQAEQEADQ